MKAPVPPEESERLAALRRYEILDTAAEEAFDELTRLAAQVCRTPVALISFVDAERQWFKSKVGLDASETPREHAFCAHAILGPDLFVVPDALADARFAENPLVTSDPSIRFYAGAPLTTREGLRVGTLCVIDRVPREITEEQRLTLGALARQAVTQMELRSAARELARLNREMEREVAERKRADREADFQARLLDMVEQAVIATDLSGRITYWNKYAERLYGWEAAEVLGRNVVEVTPSSATQAQAHEIMSSLREGQSWSGEFNVRRRDGTVFPAQVTDSPIYDNDGRLVGVVGVSQDITRRMRAEAERTELLARERAARAEAERANRAKDEFLAIVSHELRTPLTSMMGYVEMLRLGMLDERGRVRALEVIERNTQTLTQLVGDVLDTSRIVSGKMRLHTSPLDLHTVIGAAVDVMRPAFEAKGVTLRTSLDPNEGLMTGDAERLQQVVTNLLSNAVKFTPAGGEVSVSLRRTGLDVEVTVSDTGVGIAPDFLPHVFERFRQAEGASQRGGQSGLGLGLAIVRYIVERHGGTVSAESAGLGAGATFRVRLPLTDVLSANPAESLQRAAGTHGGATPSE